VSDYFVLLVSFCFAPLFWAAETLKSNPDVPFENEVHLKHLVVLVVDDLLVEVPGLQITCNTVSKFRCNILTYRIEKQPKVKEKEFEKVVFHNSLLDCGRQIREHSFMIIFFLQEFNAVLLPRMAKMISNLATHVLR
jgi:hypothetical protein